jgi:hypothetical protein
MFKPGASRSKQGAALGTKGVPQTPIKEFVGGRCGYVGICAARTWPSSEYT